MSYTYICIQNIWVFPVLWIYNLYLFIMLYLLKYQRFVFHIQFPCFGFYSVIFCTHITLLHTYDCNSGAGRQLTPSTVPLGPPPTDSQSKALSNAHHPHSGTEGRPKGNKRRWTEERGRMRGPRSGRGKVNKGEKERQEIGVREKQHS